jgi:hypothetical protein
VTFLTRPRVLVVAGAIITAVGLVVVGIAPVVGTAPAERLQRQQVVGGVIVLLGWAALAWGIHRLGRGRE